MSQSNYILTLLNIKDENIKLTSNSLIYEKFDDIEYKVIEGIFSYKPPFCTCCGCVFDNKQAYEKNGFKSSDILLFDACGYGCILRLKNKDSYVILVIRIFATTSIVNKGCFISKPVKYAIALDLKNKISEKDIAKKYRVSPNTVE